MASARCWQGCGGPARRRRPNIRPRFVAARETARRQSPDVKRQAPRSVQQRPSTGAAQPEAEAVAEGGHALARAHDDRPGHFRRGRRAPMPGHGSGRPCSPQRHGSCTISSSLKSASCAMLRAQSSTFAQSWWYKIRLICCRSAISDPTARCRRNNLLGSGRNAAHVLRTLLSPAQGTAHTGKLKHLTQFRFCLLLTRLCYLRFFFPFLCRATATGSSRLRISSRRPHGRGRVDHRKC